MPPAHLFVACRVVRSFSRWLTSSGMSVCTQVKSRLAAFAVGSASHTATSSQITCVSTRVKSPFAASTAAATLRSLATWRDTWASTQAKRVPTAVVAVGDGIQHRAALSGTKGQAAVSEASKFVSQSFVSVTVWRVEIKRLLMFGCLCQISTISDFVQNHAIMNGTQNYIIFSSSMTFFSF